MKKPRIGLSLATSYLSNNYDNEVCRMWNGMFGESKDFLSKVSEYGVTSIEINNLHMEPPVKEIGASINAVIEAGLEITIHLFLPYFKSSNELPERIKEVIKALDANNLDYSKIPMTIHGHKGGNFSSIKDAVDKTIIDINSLMNHLTKINPNIKMAFEICRDKKGGPVGVSYSEVLDIVETIKEYQLGICWDMGHTLSNIETKNWENKFPSQQFLEKVIHTHIHDTTAKGITHGPLNKDNDLLKKFIELLKSRGYEGVYNLEFYPERWDVQKSEIRMQKLLESVIFLKDLLS